MIYFYPQGVLKHNPIGDLFHHYGPEPGPLDEIKMWERQLGRLHSILRQLESPVAKDILQNLDQAQSQYSSSFNHVRKDVNKVWILFVFRIDFKIYIITSCLLRL